MKIATVSIVAGSYACNAKCPFCIASQTPHVDYDKEINESDVRIGCRLGQQSGATTCLITGKGEPTIFHKEVSALLKIAGGYFPLLELQTNGTRLHYLDTHDSYGVKIDRQDVNSLYFSILDDWKNAGLRTICLSTTHYAHEMNKKIYGPQYLDIAEIYRLLDKYDLRLRISVIMYKGGIDTLEKAQAMVNFCRELGKTGKRPIQLTMRPVVCWDNHSPVAAWTKDHLVDEKEIAYFHNWVKDNPLILKIPPNGMIFDIGGQNLCITDCLTTNYSADEMRQIIIYPDGKIAYDWKYEAAFLL